MNPLSLVVTCVVGRMNRHQPEVIEGLQAEAFLTPSNDTVHCSRLSGTKLKHQVAPSKHVAPGQWRVARKDRLGGQLNPLSSAVVATVEWIKGSNLNLVFVIESMQEPKKKFEEKEGCVVANPSFPSLI